MPHASYAPAKYQYAIHYKTRAHKNLRDIFAGSFCSFCSVVEQFVCHL